MTTHGDTSEAAFRKLVERLFLRHEYRMSAVEPRLFVGELPPGWDVPLPQGSVVVGSHCPTEFHAQVVLDAPGEPEQIVAEADRMLTGAGWRRKQRMGFPSGGFVSETSTWVRAGGIYCDDRLRRYLDVMAGVGDGELVNVRLTLNSDPLQYTPCEQEERRHRPPTDALPRLTAPPGMRQRGGGGGGGGGSVHTSATLFGELGAEAIERHYRDQLAAAGWRAVGSGAGGSWAWSAWDFSGERQEPWTGLLTVVEPPGQAAVRQVNLQATAGTADTRGGYAVSFHG